MRKRERGGKRAKEKDREEGERRMELRNVTRVGIEAGQIIWGSAGVHYLNYLQPKVPKVRYSRATLLSLQGLNPSNYNPMCPFPSASTLINYLPSTEYLTPSSCFHQLSPCLQQVVFHIYVKSVCYMIPLPSNLQHL